MSWSPRWMSWKGDVGLAQWHLDEIRNALAGRGWRVVGELDGDGYRTAKKWIVQRSTAAGPFHLSFQAMDDLEALPLEKAYGVGIDEAKGAEAYFFRKGNKSAWQADLRQLLAALDELEK